MRKKLLLLTFTIILCTGLVEIGLRLFGAALVPISIPTKHLGHIYRPNISIDQFNKESKQTVTIETNSHGFIDSEWEFDSAVTKIMVLGDSFVAAKQVAKDDRFTELLQKKFAEEGDPVRVFNLGKSGSGPDAYLARLQAYYHLINPDLVIVTIYDGNDFKDVNYHLKPQRRTA